MNRKGNIKRKLVAGLLVLAILVGASPDARAYVIPVIDAANLVENYLAQINTYLNYIMLMKQLVEMLREGDYFSFLMTLLNTLGEMYPDSEVGVFAAEIGEARDAWLGVASSYGQTKDRMNEIFGGTEDLPESPRWLQMEFMDAASIRAAKEVGKYREGRTGRKLFMEKMQAKANGQTGVDRQMQLANSNLINLYGAISDQSQLIATTNELLATQIQDRRSQIYYEELASKSTAEALALFVQEAAATQLPKIELP